MTRYTRGWSLQPSNGKYGHLQLWNAGESPLLVSRIVVASNVPLDFSILYFDEMFAQTIVDFGAGSARGIGGDGSLSPCGEMQAEVATSPIDGGILTTAHVQLWDTQQFAMDGWEVAPGHGIGVRAGMMSVLLRAAFHWTE